MSKSTDVNADFGVGDDAVDTNLRANPTALETSQEIATRRAAELRAEREGGLRKRTLGGFTRKLDVHGEVPGYHLHIFNDKDNNIEDARQHGYEFVKSGELLGINGNTVSFNVALNEQVKFLVGVKGDGTPMYGHLMKIPQEIFEEDQREQQKVPDNIDRQLQNGMPPGLTSDELDSMKVNQNVPNRVLGAKSKLYTGVTPNGA
jgi:hypothetical protein